ncbi:MAG: PilZ domain-containing protein [Candidatus Omnitrophica bacterium]|nr:PilZ domain-containing protein [Candidatus Omnitrophota bacterium]MDD5771215.1 PilZ domain-containing protein [Candidatus Omnitrophota bacterium]
MTKIARERRVHPRLEHKLPFNVAVNGYDFSTTTRNISCVGAYCHLDKYIPPFTKISVKLSLPANERAGKDTIVECRGVVVRSEDEQNGGFNIAIFFNQVRPEERKKITAYISRFLS